MKQNTQKPMDEIPASDKKGGRLWNLFIDNLKDWREFLRERRNQFKAAWKARPSLRQRANKLHHDMRHQVSSNPHRQFPESESRFVQFLLFLGGSIPHMAARLTEAFHFRRKRRLQKQSAFRSIFERIRLHPAIFLGGALAVAAICALLSVFSLGVNVSYDGYLLGTVPSRYAVKRAVSNIETITQDTLQDMDYTVETDNLKLESHIVPRRTLETRQEFEQQLTTQLGDVEYAHVLYIDDSPVVATTYDGAIEELLEQLKIGYKTSDTVDCYFVENVDVREEYIDTSYVKNLGIIAETLNETKAGEVTYTVVSGDAPGTIAEQFDMSLDDLKAANPGYDWSILHVGDVLTISHAVPYLTVVNVERQDYVQDVPYDIEYVDNDSMYQGEYKVLSKGVFGKADISANVSYVNGEETKREVVSSVTLTQPTSELQERGTKERPSWFPTGSFGWPCSGVITSGFGYRNTGIRGASTYHEGIDIANGYGTPIYASDGGTVSYSGWSGGYGYLVIIDHGNGYQTYYGHNSKLLVSVGEHVYKGQQIAKMGSTGVSSGSHCDFRIKLNGTFLNPLNYL